MNVVSFSYETVRFVLNEANFVLAQGHCQKQSVFKCKTLDSITCKTLSVHFKRFHLRIQLVLLSIEVSISLLQFFKPRKWYFQWDSFSPISKEKITLNIICSLKTTYVKYVDCDKTFSNWVKLNRFLFNVKMNSNKK